MKAHDSWPGNKVEEGRLSNTTHTHIPQDALSNTQLHMGFNTTSGVCCQTGIWALIKPEAILLRDY